MPLRQSAITIGIPRGLCLRKGRSVQAASRDRPVFRSSASDPTQDTHTKSRASLLFRTVVSLSDLCRQARHTRLRSSKGITLTTWIDRNTGGDSYFVHGAKDRIARWSISRSLTSAEALTGDLFHVLARPLHSAQ